MAEERRIVTVLFADLTGATALGEARDPEDVRALLTRYYQIARDVVSTHGGTLEKFIGDALMAVFGLPQAHGDDAQRAMSAALELRDRVREDPKLGPQQAVRIGVNTGEVVATRNNAASDFLITGDAVNVAARLQQAAEAWTILCGERTARAARDRFLLGSPTEIEVKGKQPADPGAAPPRASGRARAVPIPAHRPGRRPGATGAGRAASLLRSPPVPGEPRSPPPAPGRPAWWRSSFTGCPPCPRTRRWRSPSVCPTANGSPTGRCAPCWSGWSG